eukprot:gene12359-6027_t
MQGQFPILENISQVRKAIEDTKEIVGKSFYERTKNNHVIFNYRFFTSKTFPNPKKAKNKKEEENLKLIRECRGIVFDSKTGDIINRPFHKFFNINGELEECASKNIDLSKKHFWLEKLDGSMISSIYDEKEKIRFKTKMGYETDVSKQVEKYVYEELDIKETQKYVDFSKYWIGQGFTPLFEFVSPQNKIVLDYKETKLISIGIRNNKYGNYVKYDELKKTCATFGIHCVKNHDLGENFDEILKKIEKMEGIEGFVLKIEDDDSLYKIKCDWYRNLHKMGPKMTFGNLKETKLWVYIMKNELDDLITILAKEESLRKKLEDYAENLWTAINREAKNLEVLLDKAEFKTKKYLAEYFHKLKLNEVQIRAGKLIANGGDPLLSLVEILDDTLSNSKKIPIYILKMMDIKPFEFELKIPPKDINSLGKNNSKTKEEFSNSFSGKIDQKNLKDRSVEELAAFVNGEPQKKNKLNKKRRQRAKNQGKLKQKEKESFDIKIKI